MTGQPRIAVDIGGSHVRVAVVEAGHIDHIVEHRIVDLVADGEDLLTAIEKLIAGVADGGRRWGGPIPPIGVGVAAIVDDHGSLRVDLPSGIPAGAQLRTRLSRRFGTPVVVDNDVSLAALGELTHGSGRDETNFVLIAIGTNIGMGIVIDGKLYRGDRGAAGEIGTVPVELDAGHLALVTTARGLVQAAGIPPTGWAWLEEIFGGRALAEQWRAATTRPTGGTTDRVLRRALDSDPTARSLVSAALDGWARMIATVHAVLDPGAILLGGGIAADLPPYLDELRARARALMPGHAPRIAIGDFGVNAGLIGAAVASYGALGASDMTDAVAP